MICKTVESLAKRKAADVLILPFFEGQKPAFTQKETAALFKAPLRSGDFKGKKEEILCHYPPSGFDKRVVLVGLGKKKDLNKETLRRSYAKAICCVKKQVRTANIVLPQTDALEWECISRAVTEGVLLSNYIFDENKSEKDKSIGQMTFIGEYSKKAEIVCKNVCFARDLVMNNADVVIPQFLGEKAKKIAADFSKVKTTVLDGKQIIKEKLGLLEAVSRGSAVEPALILVEYRGAPKSKEISAIVGKGVTYDTGGLNLKPTGGMETMRDDMSGAAAVLGSLRAIAALKLPINVVAVVGSTENAIGPTSYKPGDVYVSHSGIKVEISNTDAEGRLVLADALSYVQKKYSLNRIIDIATLTGGAVVALGEEVSAFMSTDDKLAEQLMDAGECSFERLCRLPLYEEYDQLLKSKYADIKNSATRKASPILGGIFLKKFLKKKSWAHIDIAGTAFPDQLKPYQPIQATGVGVRLLTTLFEQLCK